MTQGLAANDVNASSGVGTGPYVRIPGFEVFMANVSTVYIMVQVFVKPARNIVPFHASFARNLPTCP